VSAARDEILRRVRSAIGDGATPRALARPYRTSGTLDAAARIDRLRERLLDYRARVELTTTGAIAELAAELAGGGPVGVPPGLPPAWLPPDAVEDHDLGTHELDGLAGVLTGCTLAIAER
jgi:L-lactate dehydrogenase complex protein LldG